MGAQQNKLSVVMIARNAEKQISAALNSVAWADQICVADTGSKDQTLTVAQGHGAVTKSIEFSGFGPAKREAVRMAAHEWVLALDSDEVVTAVLQKSICEFMANPDDYAGAEFKRVTNFCGNWILHSGWYPEYVFRLFNKNLAEFDIQPVHESIKYDGRIKRIGGALLHYSYPNIRTYLHKAREYAELGAMGRKKNPWILNLIFMAIKPVIVFVKKFIMQLGFADGFPGLWIAGFSAYGQMLKYFYALRIESKDQSRTI